MLATRDAHLDSRPGARLSDDAIAGLAEIAALGVTRPAPAARSRRFGTTVRAAGSRSASGTASSMPARVRRAGSGVLVVVGLALALAACSSSSTTSSETTSPSTTSASTAPDGSGTGTTPTGVRTDCAGSSCTVTLSGQGSQALVLNQTITLQNVSAGTAALRVQSQDVSCRQGESTGATALQVDCTTVTDTGVTVVAQPGTAAGATPAATSTSTEVSCSGSSCTVRLSGAGSEALAFGQNITLTGVDSGTAALVVGGGREVTCRQGDSRTEGQLQVRCATVTTDAVTVTASLA